MSISDLLYWTAIFGAKKQLGIKHACNIIPAVQGMTVQRPDEHQITTTVTVQKKP